MEHEYRSKMDEGKLPDATRDHKTGSMGPSTKTQYTTNPMNLSRVQCATENVM